jgi:FHS family L-fucose permease-like MFS transporter
MTVLLLAILPIGHLSDSLGKARFLIGGLLLVAAGLGGTALAPSWGVLLVAQAVTGLGTAPLEALINPLIADLHPRSPARALNLVNAIFPLGMIGAALLSGEMLEAGSSWRATLALWAPALVVGAALFATRRYPRPVHEGGASAGIGFVRLPLFWLLMAAMLIGGGCEAGMMVWGPSFLARELGATARAGAMTVVFFGASMALGRVASGALVGRMDPILLTIASAVLGALATAGLGAVGSASAAWVLFGLGGLFVACFWPTILAIAAERVRSGSMVMFSLLAVAGIAGFALFPWVIGAIGDAAGLRVAVGLLPASMAAQAVLLLVVHRLARRPGG